MKDAKAFFSKLRQRSEATKEVADSIIKRRAAGIYIEEMKDTDNILHDTKKHCRYVSFFTILLFVVLLEIFLPKFSNIYTYVTVPIYAKALFLLTDILHKWVWILSAIVILDIIITIKRPEWWEDLLIKIPFIRKITLSLYFYRYFWTMSFIDDKEKALSTTGNSTFSLKEDSTTVHYTNDEYPLLYAALNYEDDKSNEQTPNNALKKELSRNDYANLAKYTKAVFIDACYDFRELFSYTCIFAIIIVTTIAVVMFLETL